MLKKISEKMSRIFVRSKTFQTTLVYARFVQLFHISPDVNHYLEVVLIVDIFSNLRTVYCVLDPWYYKLDPDLSTRQKFRTTYTSRATKFWCSNSVNSQILSKNSAVIN